MNLLFWGLTIGVIGKIILGGAVLLVHLKIFEEQRIDRAVLKSIHREHILTILGILLIIMGYIFEVAFYNGVDLFRCQGPECAALLIQSQI
ncbi:MAG: hypothetical protein RLZZ234_156 [Candidatus Parcubacteria bacterium]|jgi:uncharacterized membrane protein YidH (DUF202 family)